jgi:hypothetical protein
MIAHVILFHPHPDLAEADRQNLFDALGAAACGIPSIRSFRVGKRVTHGLPGYEQLMGKGYDYAAIVEFDDMDGLRAYLAHPSHAAIGGHFTASAEAALAFDYEMVEAGDAARLLA